MNAPCHCGLAHDAAERFYVTCIDDSRPRRTAYLAGPFDTHVAALAEVTPVRYLAESLDPRAVFYGFGTVGVSGDDLPDGVLNSRMVTA